VEALPTEKVTARQTKEMLDNTAVDEKKWGIFIASGIISIKNKEGTGVLKGVQYSHCNFICIQLLYNLGN